MSDNIPGSLEALIGLAKGTKFEAVARDEKKLEELLLKEMRAGDDPITREIGSGIADGTMTWCTVASTSAYSEYIDRNVEALHRGSTSVRRSARWRQSARKTNRRRNRGSGTRTNPSRGVCSSGAWVATRDEVGVDTRRPGGGCGCRVWLFQ